MNCNLEIHDEFENMGELTCPFCDQRLADVGRNTEVVESCCDKKDMFNDNGMNVCLSCGTVHSQDLVSPYVNFHENMYRIRRKSVYVRKYHIENTINKYNKEIQLSFQDRDKIYDIFALINNVLPEVNKNRKRMISIKYVLMRIFKILGMEYEFIPLPKSKKTLRFYKRWWKQVYELIKDDAAKIINK